MTGLTPRMADLIARRFSVLGEPTRIRLLDAIHAHGELSVGELATLVGGSQANVSKHLGVLLAERLVLRRRVGPRALYRIADPGLMAICDEVCAGVRHDLAQLSSDIEERPRQVAAR
jgi:ArsR family transcriptional regulator